VWTALASARPRRAHSLGSFGGICVAPAEEGMPGTLRSGTPFSRADADASTSLAAHRLGDARLPGRSALYYDMTNHSWVMHHGMTNPYRIEVSKGGKNFLTNTNLRLLFCSMTYMFCSVFSAGISAIGLFHPLSWGGFGRLFFPRLPCSARRSPAAAAATLIAPPSRPPLNRRAPRLARRGKTFPPLSFLALENIQLCLPLIHSVCTGRLRSFFPVRYARWCRPTRPPSVTTYYGQPG
jgi:hypothetical protein